MRKILFTYVVCFLLASATALMGQVVSGTLSGKVTTATGEGVANAAVTIANTSTNASQRVLTAPDGSFSVSGLPPGTYSVDVETAGFKKTSQRDIELTATAPASVNVVLEAGSATETVEIKGTAPLVQTRSGEAAIGLGTRTIRELPVIDRNYQDQVGLMPGATWPIADRPVVTDPDQSRSYSTNGITPLTNTYFQDGATNLEPFRNAAIRVQPQESIQQMNIGTGVLTAAAGEGGGALVNTISRGGSNDWHGSAFEFHTDNALQARNFFNHGINNPKPRFVYNQFGVTAGKSLVRDKTFFFGSYEGTYNRSERTLLTTVPTAEFRAGDFSATRGLTLYNPMTGGANGFGRLPFLNNRIPARMINPFSQAISSALPLPNRPGLMDNLAANAPLRNDANKFDGRLDQYFSDRFSAFLRYGYSNLGVVNGSALGDLGGDAGITRLVAQNTVANATYSINPRLLTEVRFGYNRYDEKVRNLTFGGPLLPGSSFTDLLPNIQIAGMQPIGTPPNTPMQGLDNAYEWTSNWALHTNKHSVKWGANIHHFLTDGFSNLLFGPAGTAIFGPGATALPGGAPLTNAFVNSYAAFLLGTPTVAGRTFHPQEPSYRATNYAAFLGDTIQLTPELTVDLGLRYDVFSPLKPRGNGAAQFYNPSTNTLSFAGTGGFDIRPFDWDTNNFSPRVSFAYRPQPKTVVRGGYGITYFRMPFRTSGFMPTTFGNAMGVPGSFSVVRGVFGPTISVPVETLPIQNGIQAPNIPLSVVAFNHAAMPYVQNYSFQVQRELSGGMVFNVGYVGNVARQLPLEQQLNAAPPGTGFNGMPFFPRFARSASTVFHSSGLTSNYNSLQVNLSKRFSHGLSFLAAYTYSKVLDFASNEGLLLNPFNRSLNYGPADFDRTNVLTISHLWELPVGRGTSHLDSGPLS